MSFIEHYPNKFDLSAIEDQTDPKSIVERFIGVEFNVSITTMNEIVARTLIPKPQKDGGEFQYGFFVLDPGGAVGLCLKSDAVLQRYL